MSRLWWCSAFSGAGEPAQVKRADAQRDTRSCLLPEHPQDALGGCFEDLNARGGFKSLAVGLPGVVAADVAR